MSAQGYDLLTDGHFGSVIIAIAVSLMLFGAAVVQGYIYFQSFGDDRMFLKIMSTVILILETLHSGIITYSLYHTVITLQGFTPSGPNSYSLTASIIPEILITALVQGFFAYRIYRLSGDMYISIACCILSLIRLGGGFALAVEGFIDVPRVPNTFVLATTYSWLITLVFTVGACVDVLIAASLCYWLKRLMSERPLQNTSELVDQMVVWIIQTGLITSVASITSVVLFHTLGSSESWFAVYIVTAKLYSNSFFASLNMRRQLRNKRAVQTCADLLKSQAKMTHHQVSTNNRRSFDKPISLMLPEKSLAFDSARESFRSAGPTATAYAC